MIGRFTRWCEARCNRPPDKVILKGNGSVYLERWHVIPRNRFFNVYLHNFRQSDDDRANHGHPWLFNISIIVENGYFEVVGKKRSGEMVFRKEGTWKFRIGASPHRVCLQTRRVKGIVPYDVPCRTIFITGPILRGTLDNPYWGFYCPKGFVHWRVFTSLDKSGVSRISRGCD